MPLANFELSGGVRNLVVHVDDIGMSKAANLGALRVLKGATTCGGIVVPCSTFAEFASVKRERPDMDLGIHLTLNDEVLTHRWGPLRGDAPGLLAVDRREFSEAGLVHFRTHGEIENWLADHKRESQP